MKTFLGGVEEASGRRWKKASNRPAAERHAIPPLGQCRYGEVFRSGQWMATSERAILLCVFPGPRDQHEARQTWVKWEEFRSDVVVAEGEAGVFCMREWTERKMDDKPTLAQEWEEEMRQGQLTKRRVAVLPDPVLKWWPKCSG